MTHESIDEQTIGLIATRMAGVLRDGLKAIAADLAKRNGGESALTVDDVAARFCVSRSTVHAHSREWGGYKLGTGHKAAIRFHPGGLHDRHVDAPLPERRVRAQQGPPRPGRRSSAVLRGNPRLPTEFSLDLGCPDTSGGRTTPERPPLPG